MKSITLKNLTLKNFATFEDSSIDFCPGLNCIIGETGSGKSLILEALQIIFGGRADKKTIRRGSESAVIEASFDSGMSDETSKFFDDLGYPFSDKQIVVKRIISSSGSNKCYLNFQSCQIAHLQELSKYYIDIVGQFENQKLLSEEYHLDLIDLYVKDKFLSSYRNLFKLNHELKKKVENLKEKNLINSQKRELLEFQIGELGQFNPSKDDELKLIQSKEKILNKKSIQNFTEALSELITIQDSSLKNSLSHIIKFIEKSKYPFNETTLAKLFEFQMFIEEIQDEIDKIGNDSLDDELDIDIIIDRLDKYQKLKKKYQTDSHGLTHLLEKLQSEILAIESDKESVFLLNESIGKNVFELKKLSQLISKNRKIASKEISSTITQSIQELNMSGSSINIEILESEEMNELGSNTVRFLIESNAGEGFHPLKEIASGGELSRILLSIRKVFASRDSISIFLFDEIESGIGGETALKIGKSLKDVSKNGQVIVITHLPQIAIHADRIHLVTKETKSEKGVDLRTISKAAEFKYSKGQDLYSLMAPMQIQ